MGFFQKIWDIDLSKGLPVRVPFLLVGICLFVLSIVYPVADVLFGLQIPLRNMNVLDNWDFITAASFKDGFRAALPKVWLYLAFFTITFRIVVVIRSFFLSKKTLGKNLFMRYIATYFPASLIGGLTTFLLLFLSNGLLNLAGIEFSIGITALESGITSLQAWMDARVPSLLNVQNYWLALFVTIFIMALPGYFMHWLSHTSRFFWYVSHRAHHVPQFLYPLAVPDAFNFKLPLLFLRGLSAIVISRLIYTEPLIMEMVIWFTLSHIVEVFNHSIVHYDLALKNPIIRNFSRIFGEFGVYHLMHHSAKPEDHTINLSGAPFLFWDRLFGTYRKPYDTAPPLGLTNQPDIYMNPIRVTFSGFAQLWYEWKMNKDWGTRFKIIFGNIWYKPPVTKDFLIISA